MLKFNKDKVTVILYYYAPINVKHEGVGIGHRVGILTFSKKIIKIPTPGEKIIVKH